MSQFPPSEQPDHDPWRADGSFPTPQWNDTNGIVPSTPWRQQESFPRTPWNHHDGSPSSVPPLSSPYPSFPQVSEPPPPPAEFNTGPTDPMPPKKRFGGISTFAAILSILSSIVVIIVVIFGIKQASNVGFFSNSSSSSNASNITNSSTINQTVNGTTIAEKTSTPDATGNPVGAVPTIASGPTPTLFPGETPTVTPIPTIVPTTQAVSATATTLAATATTAAATAAATATTAAATTTTATNVPPTATPLPTVQFICAGRNKKNAQVCVHTLANAPVTLTATKCDGTPDDAARQRANGTTDSGGNYQWTWMPQDPGSCGQETIIVSAQLSNGQTITGTTTLIVSNGG